MVGLFLRKIGFGGGESGFVSEELAGNSGNGGPTTNRLTWRTSGVALGRSVPSWREPMFRRECTRASEKPGSSSGHLAGQGINGLGMSAGRVCPGKLGMSGSLPRSLQAEEPTEMSREMGRKSGGLEGVGMTEVDTFVGHALNGCLSSSGHSR